MHSDTSSAKSITRPGSWPVRQNLDKEISYLYDRLGWTIKLILQTGRGTGPSSPCPSGAELLIVDLPTATTPVLDVHPACVPGRSVIIYRLGLERPSCSQVLVRRACGSAGCDRSAQGAEAGEEGRSAVVDDPVAGGDCTYRGGPVPAPPRRVCTQRTYAYLLVDHQRWLDHECLKVDAVTLRDLERYMGLVGAEVAMPLGEPWRTGKRP